VLSSSEKSATLRLRTLHVARLGYEVRTAGRHWDYKIERLYGKRVEGFTQLLLNVPQEKMIQSVENLHGYAKRALVINRVIKRQDWHMNVA
jgi:hypothetical protein